MQIKPRVDTTVLVYTSASPDLEPAVRASLDELADTVDRSDVQVVAQLGWAGQGRRELLHGPTVEPPETVAGPLDMARPASLEDFLRWGMEKYPAKNYVVVMGGHGAGAFGAVTDSARSHMMQLPEIRQAIADSGCRPQMVIFNACLMAQAETVGELRELTPVVVGSQTEEKGLGMPLGAWLERTRGLDDPVRAGAELVAECAATPERSPSVSAVQTAGSAGLEHHLEQLGQAIQARPDLRQHIRELVASQPHLWNREWDHPLVDEIDLGRLSRDLAALPDPIRQASSAVLGDLQKMVCAPEATTRDGGAGLSIYAPHTPWETQPAPGGQLGELYGRLRMPRESGWAQAISWLMNPDRQPVVMPNRNKITSNP